MNITVKYIDSSTHEWYHKDCAICGNWVATQRAVVGIVPTGMSTETTFAHKSCLEELLRDSPEDLDVEKIERIAEEEINGNGLLAWVLSTEE